MNWKYRCSYHEKCFKFLSRVGTIFKQSRQWLITDSSLLMFDSELTVRVRVWQCESFIHWFRHSFFPATISDWNSLQFVVIWHVEAETTDGFKLKYRSYHNIRPHNRGHQDSADIRLLAGRQSPSDY